MKKRHHFVPQFYLSNFAGEDGQVWTYDMESASVRSSTVENTAYEKYLYSVTLEDGKRTDDLENLISDIESKAAPVVSKVIGGEELTGDERASFASFMGISYVRTDAFRHLYAQLAMNKLQIENLALAKNDEAFKARIKKYQEDCGPLSEEDIEILRQGMLNPRDAKLLVDKEWTLRALGFHDHVVPIFLKMSWTVFRASEPNYFIASDNPLIFAVPEQHRHPIYGGGLTDPKVELSFPLSSTTCLYATWDLDAPAAREISADVVKYANRVRATFARRFLFAREESDEIKQVGEEFKDVRPGPRVSGLGTTELSPVELKRTGKE